MAEKFEVINVPDYLNVRETPTSSSNLNIVARILQGDIVESNPSSLDSTRWMRIKKDIDGTEMVGFVAKRFLKKISGNSSSRRTAKTLSAVHMTEGKSHVDRSNPNGRAFPLGEPNLPKYDTTSVAKRIESFHKIVDWLDVEKSKRFRPTTKSTFCNIYAYDLVYLIGAYIPRVWWTAASVNSLLKNKEIEIIYSQTIQEMRANQLHLWFEEFGNLFGWTRKFDIDEVQEDANKGKVCVITAKQMIDVRSGHIVLVAPENDQHKATRNEDGKVVFPLQTQAGRTNRKYFTDVNNSKWWTNRDYQDFGFWVHD